MTVHSSPSADALLAFISAVQALPLHEAGLHSLSRPVGTEADPTARLALSFGTGYFDGSKVLVYLGDDVVGEAEPAEAARAYMAGQVPSVVKKGGK